MGYKISQQHKFSHEGYVSKGIWQIASSIFAVYPLIMVIVYFTYCFFG